MKPVAVIGGGITGLTTAFRLQSLGIPVVLYEAGSRVGGVIQSSRIDGFLAECGPNTLLETSPKISSLIHALGLEGRRMYSNPAAGNRYLVRGGRPIPLPDSIAAFFGTRLFSLTAKLRLLREPFIRRMDADREESVKEFVLRRLGREFLDYAINPLVGGVYAGDPARLSVKHAFPKLHALEQRYHSLLAGQFLGARERKRRAEVSKQTASKLSFDEGLQVLTDALHAQLGSAVRLQAKVHSVQSIRDSWEVFATVGEKPTCLDCSAVLYAGTAHGLARLQLIARGAPDLRPLAHVQSPPIASVVLGFNRSDVAHPLDGFGLLVPEVERLSILGAIFSSSLFPKRAPAGQVLLTTYLGGARNPELALLNPERQVELVRHDLRKLLGATGRPTFEHHHFFPKSIPQYEVGYGRFKELLNRTESDCPGFFLAGQYRDGISLSDCIVSGHDAATRVESWLSSRNSDHHTTSNELKAAA